LLGKETDKSPVAGIFNFILATAFLGLAQLSGEGVRIMGDAREEIVVKHNKLATEYNSKYSQRFELLPVK